MELNEAQLIPNLAILGMFAFGGFLLSMLITPVYTYFAYKNKWWKQARTIGIDGKKTPVYLKIHAAKHKRNIPTMAGIIIWSSVAIITLLFNFNRSETWLPLFTLVIMGLLGLVDDWFNIRSKGGIAGVKSNLKLLWTTIAAALGAWWFYDKLEWSSIHIPAFGNVEIGWLYIPIFIFIVLAT